MEYLPGLSCPNLSLDFVHDTIGIAKCDLNAEQEEKNPFKFLQQFIFMPVGQMLLLKFNSNIFTIELDFVIQCTLRVHSWTIKNDKMS